MLQVLALAVCFGQAPAAEPKVIISPQGKPAEIFLQFQPDGQPVNKELAELLKKLIPKLEAQEKKKTQGDSEKKVDKKVIIRIEKIGGDPAKKGAEKDLEAARRELEKLLNSLREAEKSQTEKQKAEAERARAAKLLQELQNIQKKEKQGFWQIEGKPIILKVKLAPAKSPNQEVIDLLKKAIQILEGKQKPGQPLEFELRFDKLQLQLKPKPAKHIEPPLQMISPELEKARAEVQAAEAKLRAAQAHLAKLQGTPKEPWTVVQPVLPPAKTPAVDLEDRLNRIVKEIEELRRQIKKSGR